MGSSMTCCLYVTCFQSLVCPKCWECGSLNLPKGGGARGRVIIVLMRMRQHSIHIEWSSMEIMVLEHDTNDKLCVRVSELSRYARQ